MPRGLVDQLATRSAGLAFTPGRLAILVPYALLPWARAWRTIHFRGPHGLFVGWCGVFTYMVIVPSTVIINGLHLVLARLPKTEIVDAIAVTLGLATTIDGVCIAFHPQVYGVDDATLRRGAAWLLWAGAVACYLAFRARAHALRADPAGLRAA